MGGKKAIAKLNVMP